MQCISHSSSSPSLSLSSLAGRAPRASWAKCISSGVDTLAGAADGLRGGGGHTKPFTSMEICKVSREFEWEIDKVPSHRHRSGFVCA